MVNILVYGDRSRYSFLSELVSELTIPSHRMDDENIIVAQVGTRKSSAIFPKAIELTSAQLPLATNVFFPSDSCDIGKCADKFSSILFFEEFEFLKASSLQKLEDLEEIGQLALTIVLYIPPRRFLDTDISTYDDAIENAQKYYSNLGYSVLLYKPLDNLFHFLLKPTGRYSNFYRKKMLNKIAEKRDLLHDDIGLQLDYELAFEENRCSLNAQDNKFIIQYDEETFKRASLEKIYFERAKKLIFEQQRHRFINPLLNIYKEFMKDIAFGNLNIDAEVLEDIVEKSFSSSTLNKKNTFFHGTYLEYETNREKNHIITEFLARVNRFIQFDLCNEIIKYADIRLNRLERLVKGD